MSNHYSDPTANAAIGSIDRQMRQMRKRANQIRIRRQKNLLTPAELAEARKEFVGIYRRLLKEALEDQLAPRRQAPAGEHTNTPAGLRM